MPGPDRPLITLVSLVFSEGTLSTHNFGLATPPARIEMFDDVDGPLTGRAGNRGPLSAKAAAQFQ